MRISVLRSESRPRANQVDAAAATVEKIRLCLLIRRSWRPSMAWWRGAK
jgi:hypothetical protein